jgi:hypothetical protein
MSTSDVHEKKTSCFFEMVTVRVLSFDAIGGSILRPLSLDRDPEDADSRHGETDCHQTGAEHDKRYGEARGTNRNP